MGGWNESTAETMFVVRMDNGSGRHPYACSLYRND